MAIDMLAIEAALNAYPWTTGAFTLGAPRRGARYCALGLMLRYAGVAREHLACAQQEGAAEIWRLYGPLLQREYGIPDYHTAELIMMANDSAVSQAEAIHRVRAVLAGGVHALMSLRRQCPAPPLDDRPKAWDDEAGDGATLVSV